MLEIERGKAKHYAMTYSNYRREKALALAGEADAFERQQEEIERLERFVTKFRAGTRSRQAQSKQKALDRIERVHAPTREKAIKFGFPKIEPSARLVLEADHLTVLAGDKLLLTESSLAIEKGQRIALIGPNGAGKTTTIETLLGLKAAAKGKIKLGHKVSVGYFTQHAHELPDHLTVVETMTHMTGGHLNSTQARTILGRFLFSQSQVERKVEVLSGGERRRLALATMVASSFNFLVLDEPTNHLDVEAREALEEALDAFEGTVLLISHDRALIDAVATHTASIEDHGIVVRHGDYNDFLEATTPAAPAPAAPQKSSKRLAPVHKQPEPKLRETPRKPSQKTARLITQLEASIATLEAEQGAIETDLSDPVVATDGPRVAELGSRHQAVQQELSWKLLEWERLQETLTPNASPSVQ